MEFLTPLVSSGFSRLRRASGTEHMLVESLTPTREKQNLGIVFLHGLQEGIAGWHETAPFEPFPSVSNPEDEIFASSAPEEVGFFCLRWNVKPFSALDERSSLNSSSTTVQRLKGLPETW